MTKHRRGLGTDQKGRSKGDGQYFKLPYVMARSATWRSLSGPAVKVYLELRTRYNGTNNGALSLSMDEGARLLAVSKSTIKRALGELEEKGFIVKTRPGHWYGRLATLYAVTDKPVDGHLATNAWKNWSPPAKTESRYRHGTYSTPDGAAWVPKQ